MVLLGAQKKAQGQIVAFGHHVLLIPTHVGIELAQVLVAEFIELELDQDVALEDPVVEHQVNEIMPAADQDALLPGLETETMAQLEEKILELVEQCVLQVRFPHHLFGLEPEKLENVGLADRELGFFFLRAGPHQGRELLGVPGKARPLEIERPDLAPELPHRPVAADALEFIKGPLERVVQIQNEFDLTVGKAGNQFVRRGPQFGDSVPAFSGRSALAGGSCFNCGDSVPTIPGRPAFPGMSCWQFGGQCPPNLGIQPVKPGVAVKLALIGVADFYAGQLPGQLGQELVSILGPVRPVQFKFGNIEADQPIAERQADIHRAPSLPRQLLMDLPDG